MPPRPDGPESLKKATRSCPGRDPHWDEEFLFPALLAGDSDGREFVLHTKHLPVGGRWTGNNEGEWLGKAVIRVSDIISHGAAGMHLALPVMRKQLRVGTSMLHVFVMASEVDCRCFDTDVKCFASDSPSWRPLPLKIADEIKSWWMWRCMVAESKCDSVGSFCHVHVGPEDALLVVAASGRGAQACTWLRKDEILGVQMERQCVSVSVLTVPSTDSPETGESRLQSYRLFDFQDGAHAAISDDLGAQTAISCYSAIERISRLCAPLNRSLISGKLQVVVNPTAGHKQGAKLWKLVEPLLGVAGVEYNVTMTTHAGHASDLVADLELATSNRLLVVGGDGTVLEVVNALMARGDAARQLPLATIPAGSECAFAKMTTYLDLYAAAWVLLKGHREKCIDVLRITQGDKISHAICGVGWGLAGKLAEESEELREAFGPARYLVSGLKGFVKLEGCAATVHLLVPMAPNPLPSSTAPCHFASVCDICEAGLPSTPAATGCLLQESERAAEWHTVRGDFILVALLKGTKRLAPCVHLADGLVDVVAIRKSDNMDHLELIKSSYQYLRAADGRGARGGGGGGAEADRFEEESSFVIRKALAVRLVPADERHKFNIDGEVHEGRPIEVRVVHKALACCLASRPADGADPHTPRALHAAKQQVVEVAERAGRQALDLAHPLLLRGQDKGKQLVHELQTAAARVVASASDSRSSAAQAVLDAGGALKSLKLI